jgi:hypothetical protein
MNKATIDAPTITVTGDLQCSGDVYTPGGEHFTGRLVAAPSLAGHLTFIASDAPKAYVTVKSDGTVELGEGVSLDTAARAFWDAVEKTGQARQALRASLPKRAAEVLSQAEMIAVYDGMKSEDILANVEPGDYGNAILAAYGRRVIEAAVARVGVQP